MLTVIWQSIMTRLTYIFQELKQTVPFQAACRSWKTSKKSPSLKPQKASFQVQPLFPSLLSGNKTYIPGTRRYSAAKDKRLTTAETVYCCSHASVITLMCTNHSVTVTCTFVMMLSASWSHMRRLPLSVMYDLHIVTI